MTLFTILMSIGCIYDEQLPNVDLTGTVRVPKDVAYYWLGQEEDGQVADQDCGEGVVGKCKQTDPRGMGPVYLGAFPSIEEGLYSFPHPEMGPILGNGQDGNTYPYGGNSIGRFDWACYQALVCKITTGRFESYESILNFFDTIIGQPIITDEGDEVTSSGEYRERCYEMVEGIADYEMLFIYGEQGPDFIDDGDSYVAEVTIPSTHFKEGMQIWGWMDMPSTTFEFSTCNPDVGQVHNYYNENYDRGANAMDLLNYPGKYIDSGDLITTEAATINTESDTFEITLGIRHDEE